MRASPLREQFDLQLPDALDDPFALDHPVAEVTGAGADTASGPKHVDFLVVAARQVELETMRSTVAAYGHDGDDWRPYVPGLETRIGVLVQKVAVAEDLTAGFLPLAQDLVLQLQKARGKNTLVIVVIDVWSLRLQAYRALMNLFDRAERFVNAGVLVLWNLADLETASSRHELEQAVQMAFPTLTVMTDPLVFHDQLGTPEELAEKLRATLYVLRRRVTDFGKVMRKATGASPISKPLLTNSGNT